jgi:hypothetical protein
MTTPISTPEVQPSPPQPEKENSQQGDVEVSYDQAKVDQVPDSPQAASAPVDEDVLDIIEPKKEPKTWVVGKSDYERTYVQRELSFIGKMQWFSLVGEVLDKAMSGEDRLSVNSLLSAPGSMGGQLSVADFRDADMFVQAIGKLLVHAPDFLQKSYCIWLGVPDYERDLVKNIMALPADEGGLTDEQGMEIIEIFIDQNYEALDSFFREKLGRLQRRVAARAEEARPASQQ